MRGVMVGLAVVGMLSAWSATPTSTAGGKTDSQAAVDEVLRKERLQPGDRREELRPLFETTGDAPARWQAGFVRVGAEWQPYESAVPEGRSLNLQREYETRRENAGNSSRAHRELAAWCRQRGLKAQEHAHLLAAVQSESDRDNSDLFARLGYRQVGGEWLSGEQVARWKAQLDATQLSLKLYGDKLNRIGTDLAASGPQGRRMALTRLEQLEVPEAVPAIEWTLCGRDEPVAYEAIQALDRIPGFEASQALARQAVFNRWESVRTRAVEALFPRKMEDYVPELIPLLATPTERGFGVVERSRGVFAVNYILARETDDQFQVANLQAVNFQVANYLNQVREQPRRTAPPSLNETRAKNDALRGIADQVYAQDKIVAAVNERTEAINARVGTVLRSVSGEEEAETPQDWWTWWNCHNEYKSGPKSVRRYVSRRTQGRPEQLVMSCECFAPGTIVWTNSGRKAIETIQVGDLVLSQNVETGELGFAPVIQTTIQEPKPLWTLKVGEETFQVTGGHRFWENGPGWRRTKDLRPGSILHTARGSLAVEVLEEGASAPSHNLVVAGTHTYFVGEQAILSQDITLPQSVNREVPGLRN